MRIYNLIDILPTQLDNQFDFAAAYGDDSYYIFSTQFFASEIYQHFFSRQIRLADDNPTEHLIELFGLWKAYRGETYARRAYALSIEYEPLENYDRRETREGESSTTNNLTDKRTHADTITKSLNNTDTDRRTGTETDARGIYGVNSVTAVNADTTTTTYDTTDEVKHTGDVTDRHTGDITDAHTGTTNTNDGYTLRAHGNIGVTTSQQMLASDIDMLRYDLALIALCDFLDRYTFETTTVCDDYWLQRR